MSTAGRAARAPAPTNSGIGGPLGILAGGGTLPAEIADHAGRQGRPVHIVALDGEADSHVTPYSHTFVNWGQIGRMVAAFRRHGCRQIVLAGTVRRPNLWSLRPDLGLILGLPRLLRTLRGGDDSVLRRVIGFFEDKGFEVVGLADVAPHLLAGAGPLAACVPNTNHQAAIANGLALLETLGPFDVGQAVVATKDQIIAIEGAGGTDAMIGQLTGTTRGDAVLIKWPKPGQELRLDLPAVGPRTIELAQRAGLAGICVRAGAAVFLERESLSRAADRAALFVTGLTDADAPDNRGAARVKSDAGDARLVTDRTRRIPNTRERADIAIGRRLLAALSAHAVGQSAVIARQHVLAVSAGEPVFDVIGRASSLRQWGARSRRRVGTLMLRLDSTAEAGLLTDPAQIALLIEGMAKAHLAGAAIVMPPLGSAQVEEAVRRFDEARLFLETMEAAA